MSYYVREMQNSPPKTNRQILELMSAFRPACVLGAAAELDLWGQLGEQNLSAESIAELLQTDLRATSMLLDALSALGLLEKNAGLYRTPEAIRPLLRADSVETVLPMIHHQMNVLRSWSRLAWVTKSGAPAEREGSIRGSTADRAAFIAAMHSISRILADEVVAELGHRQFRHLLDVGGASGTWTIAFLRAAPEAKATIFDLPDAIEQAGKRLKIPEFARRVTLVSGDFYIDPLPPGSDFAWVSAICHQHSRAHNRRLFVKIFEALEPGGQVAIRDVVMEPSRTQPCDGALFAINMLVNTDSGGTFTFAEFAEDLQAAGFVNPRLALSHADMNSVVTAEKPA
ncbi:MAG: methyltransferase [Thermoguttaceae bacterium]